MWAVHRRNFDKQFFHQGESIKPFEWTICVKTGDIIFSKHFINISQVTFQRVLKHRTFEVKNN